MPMPGDASATSDEACMPSRQVSVGPIERRVWRMLNRPSEKDRAPAMLRRPTREEAMTRLRNPLHLLLLGAAPAALMLPNCAAAQTAADTRTTQDADAAQR